MQTESLAINYRDRLVVGPTTRVQFDNAPTEDGHHYMALDYNEWDPAKSVIRLRRPNDNEVYNTSDIVLVSADPSDPYRFTWQRILTDAAGDGVIGYEDPRLAICPYAKEVVALVTVVWPNNNDFFCGPWPGWKAGVAMVDLTTGKAVDLISPDDIGYRNIAYLKEMEYVHDDGSSYRNGSFFEMGGYGIDGTIGFVRGWAIENPVTAWLEPRYFRREKEEVGRPKRHWWDQAGLSPGPWIKLDNETYLMFLNGRTEGWHVNSNGLIDRRVEWSTGVIVFRLNGMEEPKLLYRSDEALIRDDSREVGYGDQIIHFASSIRKVGDNQYVLYGHIGDNYVVGTEVTILPA